MPSLKSVFLKIHEKFKEEFGIISQKFVILEETVPNLSNSKLPYIYHPGVYVFTHNEEIIKVGRHLTNSRKRALEHIQDNTGIGGDFEMAKMADNLESRVFLINVKDPEDYHWVASVEIFLENELHPIIKSKRH